MQAAPAQFDWLAAGRYQGYTYAYPHKTAYRPLPQPLALCDVWARENRNALFLYLHVPFCEMRCGFCNLFTTANPQEDVVAAYLQALQRQAAQVREAFGAARFARLAIGGGTPTMLDERGLASLFDLAENLFDADARVIPASVETSPLTAEAGKLALLRSRGVERISLGVQSFNETEARAAGRAQQTRAVFAALERIRAHDFPVLNLDLIYGLPGQTVASWLDSLRAALRFAPEELYLYPLYVRPLTGLQRRGQVSTEDELRLACYHAGRELLLTQGYEQTSMRMFQRARVTNAPAYCCQTDGMIGLGCGARSYTSAVHYSHEYAVGATTIRKLIAAYNERADFTTADYGFVLNEDEQRRRFVLQSLLQVAGLSHQDYQARFGTMVLQDLPQLNELCERGLAANDGATLRLTETGLELSDAIGPWLYSSSVRALMAEYALR